MTHDQARALEAVLLAAELWLLEIGWQVQRGVTDSPARSEARSFLVDAIDELLSAIEFDERDPRLDPDVEVRRHRDAMLAHQGLKPEEDKP